MHDYTCPTHPLGQIRLLLMDVITRASDADDFTNPNSSWWPRRIAAYRIVMGATPRQHGNYDDSYSHGKHALSLQYIAQIETFAQHFMVP